MLRVFLFTIIVLITSCSDDNKPDVSNIKVDINLERFEKAFFQIDTNNIEQGLSNLQRQFPKFYPFYFLNILQLNPSDPASQNDLKNIIASYSPINDSIQKKYNNLNRLKDDLEDGFKYVKQYYPNYQIPRFITFIATFDAPGIILTPDYAAIGLHQYAGKNFSVYQLDQLQQVYPTYISRRFDREYIVPNVMKAVADDVYPDQSIGRPLIEQFVEKGKEWFLVDHFLPDTPDSLITGYTKKQLEWLKENEGNVWGFIIKNENLYSIEPSTIQTYIGESPFTQTMPETSPGNIGQWIGWQIVRKYAERNDKLTIQEVLQTPAKSIFEGAAYKPK